MSIGPVEPFDEGILVLLVRLNRPERDPAVGQELGPITQSNRLRLTPPGRHLVQQQQDMIRGQGRVQLNGQYFLHAFIQNVARQKSSFAIQGIAHEVQGSDGFQVWEHDEGLRRSGEPPLLDTPRQIQP